MDHDPQSGESEAGSPPSDLASPWGPPGDAPRSTPPPAGGRPRRTKKGGPGGHANGQKPAPAMAGTVKSVNGSTITIQDFMGFTRTIHTSSSTTYTRGGQSATSSAVTNGAEIAAQGTVDHNGTDLDASK